MPLGINLLCCVIYQFCSVINLYISLSIISKVDLDFNSDDFNFRLKIISYIFDSDYIGLNITNTHSNESSLQLLVLGIWITANVSKRLPFKSFFYYRPQFNLFLWPSRFRVFIILLILFLPERDNTKFSH